jgi:hypothetical protein
MRIKTSCESSECLDTTGPKFVESGGARHKGPPVAPPVISALPLLALLVGGLVCAAALLKYRPYLSSRGRARSGSAAAADAAGSAPGAGGGADKRASRLAAAGPVAEGREGESCEAARVAGEGGCGLQDAPSPAAASGGAASAGGGGTRPPMSALQGPVTVRESTSGSGSASSSQQPMQIRELAFFDVTADVKVHRSLREVAACALRCCACCRSGSAGAAAATPGSSSSSAAQGDMEQGGVEMGKRAAAMAADAGRGVAGVRASDQGHDGVGGTGQPQKQLASVAVPAAAAGGEGGACGSSGCCRCSAERGRWRRVLQGVSGSVGSGEVLGIMGPSGGGKSTLLMKLCGGLGGHARGGEWRSGGVVCLDGVAAPPSLLTSVTALVPQDDTLMRSLTVEECIRCAPGAAHVCGGGWGARHKVLLGRLGGGGRRAPCRVCRSPLRLALWCSHACADTPRAWRPRAHAVHIHAHDAHAGILRRFASSPRCPPLPSTRAWRWSWTRWAWRRSAAAPC